MKHLIVAVLLMGMSGLAQAGWLAVEMDGVDSHKLSIGDRSVKVGSTVLFWTKIQYVLDGDIKLSELEAGSFVNRVYADCDTGEFSVIYQSSFSDLSAKMENLISQDQNPTKPEISVEGSFNAFAIDAACGYEEEPSLIDLWKSYGSSFVAVKSFLSVIW